MLYFLIPAIELLILALVLLAGLKVYKLYSTPNIIKGSADRIEVKETNTTATQLVKPEPKNPNAVLDDYIGDFF